MTNINKIYSYSAAVLVMIVPVPGRIVFGLYMLVMFNILMAVATLCTHAAHKFDLDSVRIPVTICIIIAVTVLYKQFLNIICPVAALTLDFAIYIPAVSAVTTTYLSAASADALKTDLIEKMRAAVIVTVTAIAFFMIRDIIGFGTLTLPGWKHIITIHLPFTDPQRFSAGAFLATIPGCFVLSAVAVMCYIKAIKAADKKNEGKDSEER